MASEQKVKATTTAADTETSVNIPAGYTKARCRNLSGHDVMGNWQSGLVGKQVQVLIPAGQVQVISVPSNGANFYFWTKIANSQFEMHLLP
jgi:hypothetical protein